MASVTLLISRTSQGNEKAYECDEEGEEDPVMQTTVTPKSRQEARREIVRQIEQGVSDKLARERLAVPMHRTTIYRLFKCVQSEGEKALTDGRHGHPVKLRGEVFALVREHCQANPYVSSSAVQHLLQERFGVSVSVSQLNRVRASLGLSRQRVPREKKAENRHGDRVRLS
jgi:transposase